MAAILTMMPFAADRNYGRACNEAMALLPDDAWGVIVDHDMQFTTPHWHRQLGEAIAKVPDGTFTAVANRAGRSWQRAPEGKRCGDDLRQHCQIGEARRKRRTLLDVTDTAGFGGVVTCLSKRNWQAVGGYAEREGLGCVDHSLFFKLREHSLRSYLIEGLYVYHRRGSSAAGLTPRHPDCPCADPAIEPTQRIEL